MPSANSDPLPWQTLATRIVHDAPPFLRLSVERVRLPDGRVIDDFYRLDKPDFALVVPRLPDGRVLLLRQYKHGVRRAGLYPPGGHIGTGETPLAAVQRELLEETGHSADRWTSLGGYVVDANQGAGAGHFFLAENARPVATPRSGDLEAMELVALSDAELSAAIRSGEVNALAAIAAISLALHPPSAD